MRAGLWNVIHSLSFLLRFCVGQPDGFAEASEARAQISAALSGRESELREGLLAALNAPQAR